MKHKTAGLMLTLSVIFLLPSHVSAQGDPVKPPTCCNIDSPPPPSGSSTATAASTTDSPTQVTMFDATLTALGITRGQFLDGLADSLFLDPARTVYVVIPVITVTSSANGGVLTQVVYYSFELSQVAPEIFDSINVLYLTDGQSFVEVIFIPEAHSNP